mmetsp:Transcript_19661/g.63889  ORF Transcript_19661/g.63889 Transcript_19661/m.63889 type:complete len:488 (+) Transcript_19661:3-1466(+)
MAFKLPKPAPDARIIALRNYEDKNRQLCDYVKQLGRRDENAAWENATDAKIAKNNANKRYEALKAGMEASLDERRAKLAAKLQSEEQAYMAELESSQHSSDVRRKQLEQRAIELMAQREQERVDFANEMLYRHWRENCDGVRQGDSQAITDHYAALRKAQEHEKVTKKSLEVAEKKAMDEMMERERLKQEARHVQAAARRKERDDEAVRVLNDQVLDMQRRRELAKEEAAVDVEVMKARWAEQNAEAARAMQAVYAKNKKIGEELLAFNIQKQSELAAEEAKERAEDEAMVSEAMRQAQEEADREAELKDQKKEQDRMYRQHLQLLMIKEQESEEERDRLIKLEEEKHEAKRLAAKKLEEDARALLMREVHEDRQRQLANKEHMKVVAAEEKMLERMRMQEESRVIAGIEQEYQLQLKADRLANRMDLEAQMRAKDALKQKSKDELEREFLGAQQAEKNYQAYIAKDAEQPRQVQAFYGRKSTKWFS